MKVHELSNAARLEPQKLSGYDTPHVTIETNTTCNIRCSACYSADRSVVKSLDAVMEEIDLACTRRNLDTISLLGGEPTLHPHLPDIVRHVKAKGLVCQVLTNGVRFLAEGGGPLRALVDAGVDRFLLHVDSGQAGVHGDVDAARHTLAALLDAHGVWFGLALTLYAGEEEDLPRILAEYARYRYFDGVLATLALDFDQAFAPSRDRSAEPDMAAVARSMDARLEIEPAAYLPSNLADDDVCWLMWFYWVNIATGATLALSPEVNRAMKALYRKTHRHEFFAGTLSPGAKGLTALATALAEAVAHPGRIPEIARLFRGAGGGEHLRFHYAVVQEAPRFSREHGRLRFCWRCPDSTLRHGRLVPVCLASRVAPYHGEPTAPREVIDEVALHLEWVAA